MSALSSVPIVHAGFPVEFRPRIADRPVPCRHPDGLRPCRRDESQLMDMVANPRLWVVIHAIPGFATYRRSPLP